MTTSSNDPERLERATRARLARLAALPVDVSNLEHHLRAALQQRQTPSVPRRWYSPRAWPAWVSGVSGVSAAAALLLAALLVVLMPWTTSNVWASPKELVRLHEDLVAGRIPTTATDNWQQTQDVLRQQWADMPALPNLPPAKVCNCCIRQVCGCTTAMMLVEHQGQPVTVLLTRLAPQMVNTQADGSPIIQQHDGLNIVTLEAEGHCTVLVSKLAPEQMLAMIRSARTAADGAP